MSLPPLAAVILPIFSTLLGGYLVLKTKKSLRLWLSLSGGILLGLAFLDLIPESFELASEAPISASLIGAAMILSILFFHALDKFFDFHGHEGHEHETCENEKHHHLHIWSRIAGMGFHSFLDGLAVSGGFAISARLGILVTLAIMIHKFTDGMSTVTILHSHNHTPSKRTTWLALGSMVVLPLLGFALGGILIPSLAAQAIFLALLAGLFTHLPLSELLPQAHEGKTSRLGLALTVFGVVLMGAIRWIAG